MDITPIFPTPLGKVSNFISEDERLRLLKSIKNVKHSTHPAIQGHGASTHENASESSSRFITKDIKNRLEREVNNYGLSSGMGRDLKIKNIWSNIQNCNSVLDEHCHPSFFISGALYINVNDSCSITFHNPNPHIYFTHVVNQNEFSFEWSRFPVYNKDLILFPSWLRHGHRNHINQMDDRIVISFNAR